MAVCGTPEQFQLAQGDAKNMATGIGPVWMVWGHVWWGRVRGGSCGASCGGMLLLVVAMSAAVLAGGELPVGGSRGVSGIKAAQGVLRRPGSKGHRGEGPQGRGADKDEISNKLQSARE